MTRAEKIAKIKNRVSGFADRATKRRPTDAKSRMAAFKAKNFGPGPSPSDIQIPAETDDTDLPLIDGTLEGDEATAFLKTFNIKPPKTKIPQSKPEPAGLEVEGENDQDLDEDEKPAEIPGEPESSKLPPKEYVSEFYQELRAKGISGRNASILVLSAVLGEMVGVMGLRIGRK